MLLLMDKNFILGCCVSFTLHGLIFGISGFNPGQPEQKKMPEEILVRLEIAKPLLLPKIRTLGETKKVKKTEQKPQETQVEKKPEPSHEPVLKKTAEPRKQEPKPLSNPVKPKAVQCAEEKIDTPNPDKEAMLDFHNMVKQRIEEARRYPLWAKKKGIQGITRISFTVMPDGTCRDIKIAGSSGSEILDHEALETLERAEPFPAVPEKISKSPVTLEVGIVFSLHQN